MDPDLGMGVDEPGVFGCDEEIAIQCELEPAGDCVAVDCSDNGLFAIGEHIRHVSPVASGILQVFLAHDAQVQPGAE